MVLVALFWGTTVEADAPPKKKYVPPKPPPQPQLHPQALPWRAMNLYSLLPPDRRQAALTRRHHKPGTFAEKLERVTRGFVGAPYLVSPLGEGERPDPDPKFRIDAFDCTTFVETAIAVGYCEDWEDVRAVLDRIRYVGEKAEFDERRHLMVAQWIPGLSEAGYLEDVTETVGEDSTETISFELTEKRWKKRRIAKTLKLPVDRIPFGARRVPFVSIENMKDRIDRVPPGTIVNIIRMDVPWSPVLVTHQGLVLTPRGEKTRIVRHASPVSKRVIDEPLARMLKRYMKPRKWKIVGMNFQRIVEPTAGK